MNLMRTLHMHQQHNRLYLQTFYKVFKTSSALEINYIIIGLHKRDLGTCILLKVWQQSTRLHLTV